MNTAQLSANPIGPLKGFYRWLTHGRGDGSRTAVQPMQRTSLRRFDSRLVGVDNRVAGNLVAARIVTARTLAQLAPALRVVRVMDTKQPRASAGRMVISGRMADVCAELDRLAQAVH